MILKDPTKVELYSEYGEVLEKATCDNNAGALDSGYDVAIAFVDACPSGVMSAYFDKICANTIDKAFSARPSTLQKGKSLLLKLMEIDEPKPVTVFLLSKLNDKKPKVPPLCLEVIKEGIIAFGAKSFPIKEIIAALTPVFNGTNGPARDMAMSLIVEISKWIGVAPFHSLLESIRPVQKTEFEKLITERDAQGPVVLLPTVWLRSQRPAPGSKSATEGQLAKTANDADAARDYIEEVDITKKLKTTTDYFTLINDEKWSEQLKALTFVVDLLGPTPKIKSSCDVSDIVLTCKNFLKQGHLQLQMTSLKILALFSSGLRADFSHHSKNSIQMILSKYKEKRLIAEVHTTVMSIMKYCINMDSCHDDMIELLNNKKMAPPHARIGLLETIIQIIKELPEKISNDSLKSLAEVFANSYDDPDPKVRDTSAATLLPLSALIKLRGKPANEAMKYINSLDSLNPKLAKKLSTLTTSSSSDPSTGTAAESTAAVPLATTTTTAVSSKVSAASTKSAVISSGSSGSEHTAPAAAMMSKKASFTAGPSKKTAGAGAISTKDTNMTKDTNAAEDDNIEELSLSPEDAENILSELNIPNWTTTYPALINSAKWQDKVEAITILGDKIVESQSGGKYSNALITYMSSRTSGFKISNVNILKAVLQTSCQAAKNVGSVKFSRPAAWELIKQFGDKYSDKKTKDLVDELLTALCAAIQPSFVIKRMKVIMDKSKSPLAHQFFLEWLKQAIGEYGISACPTQFIAQFCQAEMENKIAIVRTAAVEVMGALYHQIGPRFMAIATSNDMKSQMVALLEAEFAKVGYDPAAVTAKAGAGSGSSNDGGIPRQDLLTLVDKNILIELNFSDGKTSWQNRKTAMESIIAACEKSGHFLDANKNTIEIVKALKGRINDTQANLKPIAVSCIGHLIASLEPVAGHKALRHVSEGLLSGLADNKKQMRDSTVSALQMLVTLNNSESSIGDPLLMSVLIPAIAEALVATVVGRQELLAWLLPLSSSLKMEHTCSDLTVPLVTCLQDKTAVVRQLAEQILAVLMGCALITKLTLDKATRDLPTAVKRTITPIVEKLMALYGTSSTSNATSPTAAGVAPPSASTAAANANAAATTTMECSKSLKNAGSGGSALLAPIRTSSPSKSPNRRASDTSTTHATTHVHHNNNDDDTNDNEVREALNESQPATPSNQWVFKKMNNKTKRLDEFHRVNWPVPPEEPGEHELQSLKTIWEPFITSLEFVNMLFPESKFGPLNQDQVAPVMNDLCTQLDGPTDIWLTHSDLIIRYLACCLCMRETGSGMVKVLQAILLLFLYLKRQNYMLHESEINPIMIHLIEKSGHKSDRQKALFKQILGAVSELITPTKMAQLLINGFCSKNKKSRVVCIEELINVVESSGAAVLGKSGVKEIGNQLDSKESDPAGRSPCLDLCYAIYLSLNSELPKLLKLMGDNLSERSSSMIEDRIKQKNRMNGTSASTASNNSGSGSSNVPLLSSRVDTGANKDKDNAIKSPRSSIDPSDESFAAAATTSTSLRRSAVKPLHINTASGSQSQTHAAQSQSQQQRPSSPSRAGSPSNSSKRITTTSPRPPSPAGGPLRGVAARATTPVLTARTGTALSTPAATPRPYATADMNTTLAEKIKNLKSPTAAMNIALATTSESHYLTETSRTTASASIPESNTDEAKNKVVSYTGLSGLFGDIAMKIDDYLNIGKQLPHTSVTATTTSATVVRRELITEAAESARDYVKILHAMITGEWSSESNTDDDEYVLHSSVDALALRLIRTISFAFQAHINFPSLYLSSLSPSAVDASVSVSATSNASTSTYTMSTSEKVLQMDVALVAVILATLFAIIKRKDLLLCLKPKTLQMIIQHSLIAIADPRLASVTATATTGTGTVTTATTATATMSTGTTKRERESAEVVNVVKQLTKGLNTIILRIASELPVDKILFILLPLMTRCSLRLAVTTHTSGGSGGDNHSSSSSSSITVDDSALDKITQPLSRLIRRVVYLEGQTHTPFTQPNTNIEQIFELLHDFFTQSQSSTVTSAAASGVSVATCSKVSENDLNMLTAKTVVSEIVKILGVKHVLNIIHLANIPPTSFLVRVVQQCGGESVSTASQQSLKHTTTTTTDITTTNAISMKSNTKRAEELQQELVSIIHEITSARDKSTPIAKLYDLRKQNPGLDVSESLQSISSAFRRFVLDTLRKMDNDDKVASISEMTASASAHTDDGGGGYISSHIHGHGNSDMVVRDENHAPKPNESAYGHANTSNKNHNTTTNSISPTAKPVPMTEHASIHANASSSPRQVYGNSNNNASSVESNDQGLEAMRILEGLISKPQRVSYGRSGGSGSGGPSSSPLRSRMPLKDPAAATHSHSSDDDSSGVATPGGSGGSGMYSSGKGRSPRLAMKENIRMSLTKLSSTLDLDTLRSEFDRNLSNNTLATIISPGPGVTADDEEETY